MTIGEHDVTVIFGRRGCGKSTLTRKLSTIYSRVVIFDRLQEWSDCTTFSSFAAFAEWWKKHGARSEAFRVAIQLPAGSDPEHLVDEFNSTMSLVYQTGKAIPGLTTCVVIEEAQFYCGPARIEPWLFEAIHTGRHAGLAIIANSQRPAAVHKSLVSQASNVFSGSLFEMRDIQYLKECFGDSAFKCRTLEKFSFCYFKVGDNAVRIVKTEK